MEIQIKKAVKSGNSSAVILPRAWLNKEVRIELVKKTNEVILTEVLNILGEHIDLSEVIGIYLAGSYARGEEDRKSDIDILVITSDIDKELITDGSYNILIVSKELLNQKLKEDLLPIGPMLREAKPLLNSYYFRSLDLRVTKVNVSSYIDSTAEKLKMIKEIIVKSNKKMFEDRIAYTLVLRIRTLYLIKLMLTDKNYSKIEFIKLIRKISGGDKAYRAYLNVKNNYSEEKSTSLEEIKKLYSYLDSQLDQIKKEL
jgi:hypothetical protein